MLSAGNFFLTLGRDVLIDEALFLWKGRLSWKQFTRTKQALFGTKTLVLDDVSTGYGLNSVIYTGDNTRIHLDLIFT